MASASFFTGDFWKLCCQPCLKCVEDRLRVLCAQGGARVSGFAFRHLLDGTKLRKPFDGPLADL